MDKKLISTINKIFSYRRKTVKNILKQFGQQSEIEKRVDDLTGDEIVNLAKQIIKKWKQYFNTNEYKSFSTLYEKLKFENRFIALP